MDVCSELLDRISALRARPEHARAGAEQTHTDAELLPEIEDALSVGYARALAGEAEMVRLEERLSALLDTDDGSRAHELRHIVEEHHEIEQSVATLRSALARLHRDFVALGGARVR
jgi:hypothetical protein